MLGWVTAASAGLHRSKRETTAARSLQDRSTLSATYFGAPDVVRARYVTPSKSPARSVTMRYGNRSSRSRSLSGESAAASRHAAHSPSVERADNVLPHRGH